MSNLLVLLPYIAILSITITSLGLLTARDWRWFIVLLAIQYAGIAALTSSALPLEMAITKMVTGWMSAGVLGIAIASVPSSWRLEGRFWPTGRIFRFLAALLVFIAVFTAVPKLVELLPQTPLPLLNGGMLLISMGLLNLGLTAQPLRVSVGLLTVLGGFEIIYASVETSILVAGLLAGVNLGIGLIGAYMITAPEMEQEYE